jgi:hypothetical protein
VPPISCNASIVNRWRRAEVHLITQGLVRLTDALPALAPTDYNLLVGGYEIFVNGVAARLPR